MKFKGILTFVIVAAIFAAVAQAQYTPSLMPPRTVHPTASVATINAPGGVHPLSTETCTYNFTVAGKLNSFLSFCVTVNGNIASIQSPSGFDYVAQGGVGEGYGICDLSTGTPYYDWAYFDSGTWNAPVLVSSTATLVKIARTTADGLWTLTQTITKVAGVQPYAKITMVLKNNSAITKDAYLVRYMDVDPAAAPFTDNPPYSQSFDSSQYSAWGYASLDGSVGGNALGLMLEEIGQPNVPYAFEGIAQYASAAPLPCDPTANYAGYEAAVDGSVEMFWVLELGPEKSGTVSARYQAF